MSAKIGKSKKTYRIKNLLTGEYISLGYRPKSIWQVYPSEAIRENKHFFYQNGIANFVVEEFELVHKINHTITI